MVTLEDFLKNPLEVGALWAVRAGGSGIASVTTEVGTCAAPDNVSIGLFHTKTVPFVLEHNGATENQGSLSLNFKPLANATDAEKQTTQVYYLPWDNNRTFRIELGGQGGPSLFFTGPLDGCAVVFDGTPTAPVIFHANAGAVKAPASPINDPHMAEKAANTVLNLRNGVMLDSCRAFAAGEKLSDAPSAAASTPFEYAVLIGRPSAEAEEKALMSNLKQPDWLKKRGFAQPPASTTLHASFGAIFGVRDPKTHAWAFYQQKVVDMQHGFFVLSCYEVWPKATHPIRKTK